MKKLMKIAAVMLAVVLFSVSCDVQDHEINPMPDLTRAVVESQQFQQLNVDVNSLDMVSVPAQQRAKNGIAVVINFKNNASYQKIIGFVKEDTQEIIDVMLLKVETLESPEEISSSFKNGTFDGKFVMRMSQSTYLLNFSKSKAIMLEKEAGRIGQEAPDGCVDMRSVYQCVAATIDSMPTVAWLVCMSELPICMAVAAADCGLQGCPPGGTVGAS